LVGWLVRTDMSDQLHSPASLPSR